MPTKTKIEWCDYSVNPVKGLCPMDCKDSSGKSYCYARRMYKRFRWNPEIRYEPNAFPYVLSGLGKRVFIGSTIELFGDWVKPEWLEEIIGWTQNFPEHTFIFLTKKAENLIKWSPFPDNCWVGATATEAESIRLAFKGLLRIQAKVKFISFEPLLGMIFSRDNIIENLINRSRVNWAIIGQQTPVSKRTEPKIEWVKEIVEAADKASTPVFLKNNLLSLLMSSSEGLMYDGFWRDEKAHLRQEFPKEER